MENNTLEACFEQYRRDSGQDGITALSLFSGVSRKTAEEWGVKRLPVGEALVKAWVFLESQGILVDEYAELSRTTTFACRLFAYRVLDKEALCKKLEVRSEHSYLWRVLMGRTQPIAFKTGRVSAETLESEYGEQLKLAVAHWSLNMEFKEASELTAPQHLANPPDVRPSDDDLVAFAASHFLALGPLMKRIIADGDTRISMLRAAIGGDDAFHNNLDLMKALASRKALEGYRNSTIQPTTNR